MATARAEQEERDRTALARYRQAQAAGEQILRLPRKAPWDCSDLARIRATLDVLDQALATQEEQERDKRAGGGTRAGVDWAVDRSRPN